ncbi:MAG TPA: YlzJ-like family protein [Bacillaceae bacterium]
MILHTIVPHESIFPAPEDAFSACIPYTWNGIPLLVQQEGQRYRVIRVMSTNPADYLNVEIQPGSHIHPDLR